MLRTTLDNTESTTLGTHTARLMARKGGLKRTPRTGGYCKNGRKWLRSQGLDSVNLLVLKSASGYCAYRNLYVENYDKF